MSYFTFCDLQFNYADTFFQHVTLHTRTTDRKNYWLKESLYKRDALLMGTVKEKENQVFREHLLF